MGSRIVRPLLLLPWLAVVLVLAAGCASPGSEAASEGSVRPSPEETMSDLPASAAPAALQCGGAFTPRAGGVVTVTGSFPSAVSSGAGLVLGTVTLTAVPGAPARAVVTPQADAFLVREGRVVTLPMAQDSVGRRLDLGQGRREQLPAAASLVACAGGRLPPGGYEIYARVLLSHDDGSTDEAVGGPWPLHIP
jgi:hypothetical protein